MPTPTKKEIETIFSLLESHHSQTMLEELSELGYTSFQLLIATLLSARSKDSTVIPIVKQLFKIYPTPQHFLTIPQSKLEKHIYKIGFYKTKAKHIKQLSEILIKKYNAQIPNTFEQLTSLPGVGRKTANCILAYVFNQPAIAVDIHVHRISNRLDWTDTKTPEQTETQLQTIVPKDQWINVNRLFVGHGQTICKPINPSCNKCSITKYCKFGKEKTDHR
jgi:endonuclease-3